MKDIVNSGDLLPDSLMLEVLNERLASGQAAGEPGVLLDGFPRTRAQAEAITRTADVQLAINLHVREEVSCSRYCVRLQGQSTPLSFCSLCVRMAGRHIFIRRKCQLLGDTELPTWVIYMCQAVVLL